jgi:hypothetical protein
MAAELVAEMVAAFRRGRSSLELAMSDPVRLLKMLHSGAMRASGNGSGGDRVVDGDRVEEHLI